MQFRIAHVSKQRLFISWACDQQVTSSSPARGDAA